MNETLTTVWESYARLVDLCGLFKTKEQAENHGLFEVGRVSEAQVYLSEESIKDLNEGKAIWV